jgi:hypothetical protein
MRPAFRGKAAWTRSAFALPCEVRPESACTEWPSAVEGVGSQEDARFATFGRRAKVVFRLLVREVGLLELSLGHTRPL